MKYRKASFWIRVVAHLIDAIILGLPIFVLQILVYDDFLGVDSYYTPFFLTYCIVMERYFQATLGKKLLGLKVIKTNGRKPNFVDCFWRNMGKYISALPYGYGFLRILAPHHIQTIHDELARCFVVDTSAKLEPTSQQPPPQPEYSSSH